MHHGFFQIEHFTQLLDAQDGRGGTTYSDHLNSLMLEALTNLDSRIAGSLTPVAEQVRENTEYTYMRTDNKLLIIFQVDYVMRLW